MLVVGSQSYEVYDGGIDEIQWQEHRISIRQLFISGLPD